jgi:Something about silencing, SAS, complex subunit 4
LIDYINPDDTIRILNEPLKDAQSPLSPLKSSSQSGLKPPPTLIHRNHYELIDLLSLAPDSVGTPSQDPLDDNLYLKAHRRSERREKQLRNIEKERAQHEKGQLETLLDSLQGPDWLRVMGVTGITDGARKEWEPKRDYFIREVRALLEKFARWREAEKRLLQEKEIAFQAKEEDDEEEEEAIAVADDNASSLNGPDSSDVDAWAAHQLQQEAKSASLSRSSKPRPPPKPPRFPDPPKPFLSFFSRPYKRVIALGKGRQGARRSALAFGHPVPDISDFEFKLPSDYVTPEALLANARKRRRLNREKKEGDSQ